MPVPKGTRIGGRQKGTPNKVTANAKQAFQMAFDELGGVSSLVTWAQQNETDFYKLFSKLIPQDVNANISTHEAALSELK